MLLFGACLHGGEPWAVRPNHLRFKHLEYQGIGFDRGYSTVELFLSNGALWRDSNLFFLDLRGHVFNDGKPAGNGGIGWRYLFDSQCQAVGLNAYYDYRKGGHMHANQLGCGLEYLTPRWECRANGYVPWGSRISHQYDLKFDHFSGHQLYISRKHQFALAGGDAEVGYRCVRSKNFELMAAAGPYYFQGSLGQAAIGGKVRLEASITPYLRLEMGDSYDSVFHNRFQFQAAVSIPFGPRSKSKKNPPCCSDAIALQSRVHEAPYRNEIVVFNTEKKTSVGLDPETGLPLFFVFVDNTSSSDGTFESPYPTLSAAQANSTSGDVIYVFPGDGTAQGMESGITLQNNQRFLGAGISHSFSTTLGTVDVPPQAIGLPHVIASIFLGNSNEVSGFYIDATDDFGITAPINTGNNSVISQNTILAANNGACIALMGNPLMGNVSITDCILLGGDLSETVGVVFFTAEVGNIRVANNIFSGVNSATGLAYGIDFFQTQYLNVTITNNIFSSAINTSLETHAIGVDPFAFQDTLFLNLAITDNQINLPVTYTDLIGGVVVKNEAGEGPFNIVLQGNTTVTPFGIPGYWIDNTGPGNEVFLQFGPDNSGTLLIDGLVTIEPSAY